MEPAVGKLHHVIIDCADRERMAAFWGPMLGVGIRHRTDSGYLSLHMLPNEILIVFQQVREPKTLKNRLHLDIQVPDVEAATARVLELGGTVVGDVEDWRVCADPEGNEFCLLPEAAYPDLASTPPPPTPG